MNFLQLSSKSDIIGTSASTLCLIHCIATPFLFVAQAEFAGQEHAHSHPMWWGLIDIFFLVISFIAVWWSAKNTSKAWIRYSLWISWIILGSIVVNEKLAFFHLPEAVIYAPAVALIGLHLYNRKYCTCSDKDCPVHDHDNNA